LKKGIKDDVIRSVVARKASCGLGVGHHQGHTLFVGAVNDSFRFQVTLQFWTFVIQEVIVERATTQEFAGACCFEPLGGCFAGLELGHFSGGAWHKRQT
tara:strand:- start:182 stop:478 length:297 start_codon:yes stop_codon:yes gene_type:complete